MLSLSRKRSVIALADFKRPEGGSFEPGRVTDDNMPVRPGVDQPVIGAIFSDAGEP